jgi:hypothetical protein
LFFKKKACYSTRPLSHGNHQPFMSFLNWLVSENKNEYTKLWVDMSYFKTFDICWHSIRLHGYLLISICTNVSYLIKWLISFLLLLIHHTLNHSAIYFKVRFHIFVKVYVLFLLNLYTFLNHDDSLKLCFDTLCLPNKNLYF